LDKSILASGGSRDFGMDFLNGFGEVPRT